ncbi:hypothetical protein [Ferrovibrio terrae]
MKWIIIGIVAVIAIAGGIVLSKDKIDLANALPPMDVSKPH